MVVSDIRMELSTAGSASRCFKVVFVGDANVGKTSLFQRLRLGVFKKDWQSTVNADMVEKEYTVDDTDVKLQIWDTGGCERYRSLTSNYFHSASGCICVYDLETPDTLYSLMTWLRDVREFQPTCKLFLVGNKCDMIGWDDFGIMSEADAFQRNHGIESHFFTSAKSGQGVDIVFQAIATTLLRQARSIDHQFLSQEGSTSSNGSEREDRRPPCC